MDITILPLEILEMILTYLDIHSIKALRLTNRNLAVNCIGPRFLSSIGQPILDVTPQDLRSLHALSRNPALRKMVSCLHLGPSLPSFELEKTVEDPKHNVRKYTSRAFFESSKIAYSSEHLSNLQSQLDLLRGQQEARTNESSSEMIELLRLSLQGFGKLEYIGLSADVFLGCGWRDWYRPRWWHLVWLQASHVFSLVMTAIAQSGVSVRKLNLYHTSEVCCIPCGHVTTFASSVKPEQLEILSKSWENFRLSISGEVQDSPNTAEPDEDGPSEYAEASHHEASYGHLSHDDSRALLADGTPGITSLLKYGSSLRVLDLSFRHTVKGGKLVGYERVFESIAHETHFPLLESCSLRGFSATGESLLFFLQKHPNLRYFELRECHLTTGSWTPIFSHLENWMPELTSLGLARKIYAESKAQHRSSPDLA